MSSAEEAYLFRHALLREAAYQLQLPSDRARLHALAFTVIEALAGGRSPGQMPLTTVPPVRFQPHAADTFAAELADHSRLALLSGEGAAESGQQALHAAHRHYRRRAAEHADRTYRLDESSASWRLLADLLEGPERGEALFRAAQAAWLGGNPRVAEPLLDQAVEIHRRAGTRRFEGLALANLAALYLQTGRDAQAERNFEAALVIFRAVGDRRSEANGMGSLAGLYATTERYEQAERLLEPALAIFREIGERRSEGMALEGRCPADQPLPRPSSSIFFT